MILIADSGSTKTDWCVINGDNVESRFSGQGINPFQQNYSEIEAIIADDVAGRIENIDSISEAYVYGAGCREEVVPMMKEIIRRSFRQADTIEVNSDLLGAARALFAGNQGIACILGTGSNSCLYDGCTITSNVPPLGYILGDEGSGAVLGRLFINAMFKGVLPSTLCNDFLQDTGLTLTSIIQRVYREPLANRFLASTSLFIRKHLDNNDLCEMVKDNFRSFFRRNLAVYGHNDLPVGAIGSIAFYYERLLAEVAKDEGYNLTKVMKSPMDGLICYHAAK